jgi:hypothetical protein
VCRLWVETTEVIRTEVTIIAISVHGAALAVQIPEELAASDWVAGVDTARIEVVTRQLLIGAGTVHTTIGCAGVAVITFGGFIAS